VLDHPAPGVEAEISFRYQYMRRFLDPDTVVLGQVLMEDAGKRTVYENDRDYSWQLVQGIHLVLESNGNGHAHTASSGSTRLASTWPSVSVSTRRLRPLTNLPASKLTGAYQAPGGRDRVLDALHVR